MNVNPEKKTSRIKRSDKLWFKVLVNLCIMCGVGLVILWIATIWLDTCTHHGEYIVVPDIKGKSYGEARQELLASGFTVELTDSIYDTPSREPSWSKTRK